MNIAFFGSSLVSAYWNGAATYYRGLLGALAERGHAISFFEPDAFDRQAHRDIPDPDWAEVVVYPADQDGVERAVERARGHDLVVKASGVGAFDAWLEREIPGLRGEATAVVFWDVDAPATLERLDGDPSDPFHEQVRRFDAVFTYGGGPPVVDAYRRAGARDCVPVYNAVDPSTHHPVPPSSRFTGDLGFLGNRLPDREARVDEFFFEPARRLPEQTFLIGGSGWDQRDLPGNVRALGHVYTRDHNAFNCSPRAVINVNRDSMARFGFSPATRVFEAAGAGACLVTDAWEGIEYFLEPGFEILVVEDADDVVEVLGDLPPEAARAIGDAALRRVVAEHTYAHRAAALEDTLQVVGAGGRSEVVA